MFIPTKSQEETIRQGIDWFRNGSEQVFEIDGQAGTGKSVVLYEIVRQLRLEPFEVMPMAYTGQASIVMRMKGFPNAKSIHSSLYHLEKVSIDDAKEDINTMNTLYNTKNTVLKFVPLKRGQISKAVKLMVVDEGRMVPRNMRDTILQHGIKVLVAGDQAQLPPIADEPAFLTGYNIHHLNEIMRQKQDDPILYIANRARHGLPIHNGLYGRNVLVCNDDEITDDMLLSIRNVICGTNKSRQIFNNRVRELLGYSNLPIPAVGERIICRNNNWDIEVANIALTNGLSGIVTYPITPNHFVNKNTFLMTFLPDLLNQEFINIPVDYEYLLSDLDRRAQIKNSKYNHGNLFEYAYALTTHLAQGAEYPCGIYYEEFLRPNIQNQLNYTGITRFKEFLIYAKRKRRFY